jgi:hypothetical protein
VNVSPSFSSISSTGLYTAATLSKAVAPGRVCQLGGARLSVGRGASDSWAGRPLRSRWHVHPPRQPPLAAAAARA